MVSLTLALRIELPQNSYRCTSAANHIANATFKSSIAPPLF